MSDDIHAVVADISIGINNIDISISIMWYIKQQYLCTDLFNSSLFYLFIYFTFISQTAAYGCE